MRSNWFWIKILNVVLIVGAILFYNQAAFYHKNAEEANKQQQAYAQQAQEASQAAEAAGSGASGAAAGTGASKYKDGTYSGSGQGYGGAINLDVTVEQDTITDIQVTSAAGETDTYFNSAIAVIDEILTQQTPDVDTVSGATLSSNGIINAVKAALEQAAKQVES